MSQTRKHPRFRSLLRCWFEAEGVTLYARVGNLSEGGLFLHTATPLANGARARVRLGLAERPPLRAEATVVWARDGGQAGMGLAFSPLDEGTLGQLRSLLADARRTLGAAGGPPRPA